MRSNLSILEVVMEDCLHDPWLTESELTIRTPRLRSKSLQLNLNHAFSLPEPWFAMMIAPMPEENRPLVSIVISNYNYDRFVGDAINSGLTQSYSNIEVIVVDDGSIDNSREIIDGFGTRIISIYKGNGGQASSFNAGFLKSRGELVLFLDADDYLEKDVIAEAVRHWDGKAAKIHYRLDIIDQDGKIIGQDPSSDIELPHGNIKAAVLSRGHYHTPPASGNLYHRTVLEIILPIPEIPYRRAADSYLYTLAPLYGDIVALPQIGGKYRMHGANGFLKRRRFSNPKDLAGAVERFDRCVALIENFTKEKGLPSTYSPKFYATPNFTRLLLLRVERKLDYSTTFHLLGNILYAIFTDKTYRTKQRLQMIAKMLLVAFAPMAIIWRIYPNSRPVVETNSNEKPPSRVLPGGIAAGR